jgi:hypothetical protein
MYGPNRSNSHGQQTERTDAQLDIEGEWALYISKSTSSSHTIGATRQKASSMGVESMGRYSVSYIRDSASALVFLEPGL